jgi:cyclophilin family peptidyl-prolyl cis-trans isomerase
MASIRLDFEKGGTFTARLLEEEAPKTCATLKGRLPFEYLFQQSIVSGQVMVAIPPDLTVEPENQRVAGILPGALSFLVADEPVLVPDEIYIAYGIFISRGLFVDAKQPVNVFGQIDEGLDELREIGARIIRTGAEVVRFSLVG